NVPGALLAGIMSWVGLYDPPPRLAIVELPGGGESCGEAMSAGCREAVAELARAARESVRELVRTDAVAYGAGVATLDNGATRLVGARAPRGAASEAMAKSLRVGGTAEIRGRLLGRRKDPSFEVFDPQGRWTPMPIRRSQKTDFAGTFSCEGGRGAYQVEVL